MLGTKNRDKRDEHWQFINALQAVHHHVKNFIDTTSTDRQSTGRRTAE